MQLDSIQTENEPVKAIREATTRWCSPHSPKAIPFGQWHQKPWTTLVLVLIIQIFIYIYTHTHIYLSISSFFSFCIRSFFPPRFILLRTPPPLFGLCLTRDGSRHECWHVRTKFTNSLLSGHRRDWPPRCGHPGIRLLLHRLYFTVSNPVANSGVADWWRTESKPGK